MIKPFFTDKGSGGCNSLQIVDGDRIVTDEADVADKMNDFYINITSQIGEPPDPDSALLNNYEFVLESERKYANHPSVARIKDAKDQINFSFSSVSTADIESIIKDLNPRKATGYDKIPPKFVKAALPAISGPLTAMANTCISSSTFPQAAKYADVTPIYKKEDLMNRKNYRPVSVLPCMSKILEIALKDVQKAVKKVAESAMGAD